MSQRPLTYWEESVPISGTFWCDSPSVASVTSPPSTFLGLLPLADSLVMKVGEFSTSLVSVVCWEEREMHSLVNYKMDARILYSKVIPPEKSFTE